MACDFYISPIGSYCPCIAKVALGSRSLLPMLGSNTELPGSLIHLGGYFLGT